MSAYMTKIRAVTLLDGDWNVEPWVVCQAFARWQRVCGKKVWTCFFLVRPRPDPSEFGAKNLYRPCTYKGEIERTAYSLELGEEISTRLV